MNGSARENSCITKYVYRVLNKIINQLINKVLVSKVLTCKLLTTGTGVTGDLTGPIPS